MISQRHEKILKIISENIVETQEELAALLKKEGFDVTQATVSRDIKKLKLIKLPVDSGGSKYAVSDEPQITYEKKFLNYIRECEADFACACNIVVVKCLPGMAQSLCAMLDKQKFDIEIVGTIAGDDTIFIVMRSEADAQKLSKLFK